MSQCFIELRDRIITDEGEVVARYNLLRRLVFDGLPLNMMKALPNEDVTQYNVKTPNAAIPIYEEGAPSGPLPESYEWNIPLEYQQLVVEDICSEAMYQLDLAGDETYVSRLMVELGLMRERNMYPFVRALVYVRDQFRKYNVVWGVGRGSSCASLIMFLLQINKVDPVLYDIPLEEFFKPGVEDDA